MNLGPTLGASSVVVIGFEQHFAGLFIERRLGIGHNEQALDRLRTHVRTRARTNESVFNGQISVSLAARHSCGASTHQENVFDAERWLPIFLERVDAATARGERF